MNILNTPSHMVIKVGDNIFLDDNTLFEHFKGQEMATIQQERYYYLFGYGFMKLLDRTTHCKPENIKHLKLFFLQEADYKNKMMAINEEMLKNKEGSECPIPLSMWPKDVTVIGQDINNRIVGLGKNRAVDFGELPYRIKVAPVWEKPGRIKNIVNKIISRIL